MIDKIKEILRQNNYSIIMERPIPYGCRLELNNGTIILIYPHKNKYCFQGKNIAKVSRLLRDKLNKDNFDIAEKTTMVDLLNRETDDLVKDHDKEVRKQVCDEIRKFYTTHIYDRPSPHTDVRLLLDRIDQIEKRSDSDGK